MSESIKLYNLLILFYLRSLEFKWEPLGKVNPLVITLMLGIQKSRRLRENQDVVEVVKAVGAVEIIFYII